MKPTFKCECGRVINIAEKMGKYRAKVQFRGMTKKQKSEHMKWVRSKGKTKQTKTET